MTVTPALLRFIQSFEGWSPTPYNDGTGVQTIGWGFTASDFPKNRMPGRMTRKDGDDLLRTLLSTRYSQPVLEAERKADWRLTQPSREALISFTYNLGGGWVGSTSSFRSLWTAFMARDPRKVAKALLLYVNPGTSVEAGLRRRREAEGRLFLAGFSKKARWQARLDRVRLQARRLGGFAGHPGLRRLADRLKRAIRRR